MELNYTVTAAQPDDAQRLAAFKSAYVQNRYQGYVSGDLLSHVSCDSFLSPLSEALNDRRHWADLLCRGEEIVGYTLSALEEDGIGVIEEALAVADISSEPKRALMDRTLHDLRSRGCSRIRLWVLRDNLCARFMIESYGFRAEGQNKIVQRGALQFPLTCYSWCFQDRA